MSVLSLETAKRFLDVIHNADDAKLQMLLNSAEDEAVQYMNRGLLEPVPAVVLVDGVRVAADPLLAPPDSMLLGVMLLLQATYQASPDDIAKLRTAAEVKLAPHRIGWGA
ncbi:head-tail connector protein [Achromobacter seleniivolatilans]|uniref:Head-tail connector protein n=1 Tax=Achromobacter seleniivolatilans TaxID=3047478 RepID=A0ABY9M7S2_9BURK|nr:head-tail connector protein [Achromobacter sp. R39]WMD23041.1 head-tail connector protein [Achromobacter sp. R39]